MAKPDAANDAIEQQAKEVERCLGLRIAEFRRKRGITLKSLSKKTGISEATLSRVENLQVSLNAYNLVKLAKILDVDISDFFHADPVELTTGRRTITRKFEGENYTSERYSYEVLCAELSKKAMTPSIDQITARTLAETGGLKGHGGEEFIYVLAGVVEIHTEFYKPARLEAGDAMYLDSQMAHAYVSVREGEARILVVTA
jgi:transcriptional regulator with XRE-family HTH domain